MNTDNQLHQSQARLNAHFQLQTELAASYLGSGQLAIALELLTPLLVTVPTWGMGWKLKAAVLTRMARREEAMQAIHHAAQYLPQDADIYNIAGTLLRETGQIDQAISCYLQAVSLNPALPEVHNNLGGAFMIKGETDNAVTAFGNALKLQPDYPEANQNLGSALLARNEPAEAIACYLRAAELKPTMQQALSAACLAMLQNADWDHFDQARQQLQVNLERPGYQAALPFVFNGLPGSDRQQHLRCAAQFATEQFEGFYHQSPLCGNSISTESRLRIGYLSADFHKHATAYLLVGVLECHDRSQVEVYAYSYGRPEKDAIRQRLMLACNQFRDIQTHSHAAAAALIAQDKIDILVDLKGYTEHGRPQIAALRPAPVVVNWLGYPGTMGQRRLADYIIGDPIVTPLTHQADYSETIAQMPDCYQPTDATRTMGPTPTRQAVGLPEDAFVFCSFNQIYKITPSVFDLWCQVVVGTPGGVLWLLEGPPTAMTNLRREALLRGLTVDRLIFGRKLPQTDHLARLQLADLALDTFPYTSHTTGSDALWAGVPLLTLIGETFGSRVAASLLTAVGLPQLIIDNPTRYVEQAIRLAQDHGELTKMRRHLIEGRGHLPLFDTHRFTRHLEALYTAMRNQQISQEVRAIAVEPLNDTKPISSETAARQCEFPSCP